MPWCGFWGATGSFWWVLPLIGLIFMGVMFFVCFRGFCGRAAGAGGCRCKPERARSEPVGASGRPT